MREVEKRVDDFHTKIVEEHRRVREEKSKPTGGEEDGAEMDFVDILLSLPGEDGKKHMEDENYYRKPVNEMMMYVSIKNEGLTTFILDCV
ncbi:hypothetical protein RchiOBHm_Chr1g0359941 [Rosa chinensis]|uniref:Uncharacterized protein n=1 Tax=Rosa chinensis TaxID=74649 RepID=A0A2P6SIL9_ROSCH|nr:hypothetical protein RchiOBHm_Chr1g0359911 [Rosa chinensis]PRQ58496.1 hypothetical protein RchiOBHm_Chr1g0359941 [Rosa chinensis]